MFDSVAIKNATGAIINLPAITNVDGQKYIANTTIPFDDLVAMGMVPGVSSLDKWGVTPTTSASAPVDVWEGVGEYVFAAGNTITHIRGTNDADDGKVIELLYQLDDGTEAIQSKAVGLAHVFIELDTPCNFVATMINRASSNIVGNIQVSVGTSTADAAQKAFIIDGNNQTQMAIYRIPKQKVGFLKRGEVGIELAGGVSVGTQTVRASYRSQRPGQAFTIKKSISMITNGASIYGDKRVFKDVIPGMTALKLSSMISSDADIGVWGAFDLEFWDENLFPDAYLIAIGQPGY
jgi:hypothetical protein